MYSFKILPFSIDFPTNIFIFSVASGGGLRPPNSLQIHISKIF